MALNCELQCSQGTIGALKISVKDVGYMKPYPFFSLFMHTYMYMYDTLQLQGIMPFHFTCIHCHQPTHFSPATNVFIIVHVRCWQCMHLLPVTYAFIASIVHVYCMRSSPATNMFKNACY